MTELSKSGSASRCSIMSWQTSQLSFFGFQRESLLSLVFEENLWNHFRTQFAHFHVFSKNFPHFISANGKLLRNHSYSQLTICMHQLFHTINVAISPACHRPARSLIVLTFFLTLSESFVPFKSKSS